MDRLWMGVCYQGSIFFIFYIASNCWGMYEGVNIQFNAMYLLFSQLLLLIFVHIIWYITGIERLLLCLSNIYNIRAFPAVQRRCRLLGGTLALPLFASSLFCESILQHTLNKVFYSKRFVMIYKMKLQHNRRRKSKTSAINFL